MFTRFALKVVPKLIANPVLAAEMAPVFIAVGVAAAVHDIVKNN